MRRPAVLGGVPAFPAGLPYARPARPPLDAVVARLAPSYDRGVLTSGPLVRELEDAAAARLGVRHVVALSSCTSGLALVLQAVADRAGGARRGGTVVMPGFTFSASAHAALWAGLVPRFADCGREDQQLDPADAAERLDGAVAVMGVHMGGAPCHPSALEALGRAHDVPVVFDAAHGFGAASGDRQVGALGLAEVFSLSPTKPLVAGEGGLVATSDAALAERLRHGRDYGNSGDYDPTFPGLNARMSELHAAVALESLDRLDAHLARRRELAARYRAALAAVPGLVPQHVEPGDATTAKLFTVVVDEQRYGLRRDDVVAALRAEGVDTRTYFSPPVHRQAAYRHLPPVELPDTDWVAARVVNLPLWRDMPDDVPERVVEALAALAACADEVRDRGEVVACASPSPAVLASSGRTSSTR